MTEDFTWKKAILHKGPAVPDSLQLPGVQGLLPLLCNGIRSVGCPYRRVPREEELKAPAVWAFSFDMGRFGGSRGETLLSKHAANTASSSSCDYIRRNSSAVSGPSETGGRKRKDRAAQCQAFAWLWRNPHRSCLWKPRPGFSSVMKVSLPPRPWKLMWSLVCPEPAPPVAAGRLWPTSTSCLQTNRSAATRCGSPCWQLCWHCARMCCWHTRS